MHRLLVGDAGKWDKIRVAVGAFITLPTVALLWPFLTGAPGKALAPLWGNPYEVKNAVIIGSVLAVIAAATTFSRRQAPFVIALLAAVMITAGPAATAIAAFAAFSAIAVGFQLISRQGIATAAGSHAARLAIAFWLGKAVYLLCLSLLSGFPINTRFLHGIILFAIIIACRRGTRDALDAINAAIIFRRNSSGWSGTLIRFLLRFSILLLIFATIHPSMDGDAMTMHMRIGREMLLNGLWGYDVSEYVFSVMALGPQLNFSAMFLLGGVEAVKAELFVQFLTVLTLAACGAISSPSRIGMAMAAVFACVPIFVREISGLYVELTLCGFSLAAAALITSAVRRQSRELVLLALLCAAGAMASKTHGVILGVSLCIVAIPLWLQSKRSTAPSDRRTLFIIGAGLVLACFFYVVAWWKTGNPVFPFMNGLFHSPYWLLENFVDSRWIGHVSWDMPWRMTFESSLYEESANGSLGLLVIFLGLCMLGLTCLPKVGWVTATPLFLGVLYLIGAGSQSQYLRYLLPGLLMVGTSLVFVLRWSLGRINPLLWYPAILALLIANVVGMPSGLNTKIGLLHIPAANYLQAGKFRGMYSLNFQEETLNGYSYIGNFLNSSARSVPTVLMLGRPFGAYINGRTIYTSWHNYTWRSKESRLLDEVEFDRYLVDNRVSHIVVDPSTFEPSEIRHQAFMPMVLARYKLVAELWGAVKLYEAQEETIRRAASM